ncbi:MAG: CPXCG motif-containing cysteine-rich protein [Gammaproteobacteria bacterium]
MIEATRIQCPYCGESFDITLDASAGTQSYIEDCEVCCRPIELRVDFDGEGELSGIQVRRDDE